MGFNYSFFLKKNLLFLALTILSRFCYSQLSTVHYIPPIFAQNALEGVIDEASLFLSTPYDTIFYVKLYEGTDYKVKDSIKLSSTTPVRLPLGKGADAMGVVEGLENLNKKIDNEGIKLTAEFPFFANIRTKQKSQGGSLTSKGQAGLGTEFRTGRMLSGFNPTGALHGNSSHFISVMATKNNTRVTFSDFKRGVYFHGTKASGKKLHQFTTLEHTVTLNAGQSYIIAEIEKEFAKGEQNNGFGILVSSTKPIAVNIGSAVSSNPSNQGGWDVGIDQIVPINNISNEYILIKGQGIPALERPVVVATEDNTQISLNGESVATLKAGDKHIFNGKDFSAEHNMYVSANKPIYIYQTIAGSKAEKTCGLNFVPPLCECISANSISIPKIKYIGENIYINIVGKPYTDVHIYDTDKNVLLRTHEQEETNLNKDLKLDWYTYKYHVPKGVNNIQIKSTEAISVSMTVQSGAIGAGAYFSGFTPSPILVARGGVASFYKNGVINFDLKQHKKFRLFKWYKDGKLIQETKTPRLTEIREMGEYYVVGVDKSCRDHIFKSNTIKIQGIKEVELEDVQDLFTDEVDHELEKAIIDDNIDPTILVNLNYEYNKAELVKESIPVMEEIISILKKYKEIKINILAHTDCKGSADYNLALSQKRADYVMNHMIEEGISADRLKAIGMGESSPLKMTECNCDKNNCTEAQLALNRRSEFVIIK